MIAWLVDNNNKRTKQTMAAALARVSIGSTRFSCRQARRTVGACSKMPKLRGSRFYSLRDVFGSRDTRGETQDVRTSFYDTEVDHFASLPLKKLTILEMIEFGKDIDDEQLVESARYVHEELPKRVARRLSDMETLPYIVLVNPYIKQVYELYMSAFRQLINFPEIKTREDDEKFTETLKDLVGSTVNVVELLAKGVVEAQSKVGSATLNIDDFLNHMLMSRIGRRVVAEQHIMLHSEPRDNFVGVIELQCSPSDCIAKAAREASQICTQTFGVHPQLDIVGHTDVTLPFIPVHLNYVFLEILKNAMRAEVECSERENRKKLNPIEVLITSGERDITIRVSDRGGGIPTNHINRVFSYGFTTVSEEGLGQNSANIPILASNASDSPMAGLGFGLPLSRLYTRCFGGNLDLVTMDGYGTDVYITLDHSGETVKVEI